MKSFQHLPTKSVSILDKKGRVYISSRHHNPNKNIVRGRPDKVDRFKKYLDEIGNDSKNFAEFAKAYISPDEFIEKMKTGNIDFNEPIIKRMYEYISGIAHLKSIKDKNTKIEYAVNEVKIQNSELKISRTLKYKSGINVSNNLMVKKEKGNIEKDIAEKMLITQVSFLEEYFGKGKYSITASALSFPDMFEPMIGAGIWYYRGMDIIKFNAAKYLVDVIKKINESKGNLKFQFPKNSENNVEKLMLGRLIFKDKANINEEKRKKIERVLIELFNVVKFDSYQLTKKLLSDEGLPMRVLLKHISISYLATITSKDRFIRNYIRRNSDLHY